MLKILKDGKVKFILNDDDEEPVPIDELILNDEGKEEKDDKKKSKCINSRNANN